MPDITRYTPEEIRRMREEALRRKRLTVPTKTTTTPRKTATTPTVNRPTTTQYTTPRYPSVGATQPGMPPAIRSTPDNKRREIDKQFINDMLSGASNRYNSVVSKRPNLTSSVTVRPSEGSIKASGRTGEITAARNQIAANLNTITRLQSQYANTGDREMISLLDNAHKSMTDYSTELDALTDYVQQFDTPQQQALFEYESDLDKTMRGADFDDTELMINGLREDMRTETDPANRALIAEQIKLMEDWRRNNASTRTESLMGDRAALEDELRETIQAYDTYNDTTRRTSYDAIMADNYTSSERPTDAEIIAEIDRAWQQREAELRAEGYDDDTIAIYAESYESAKDDPALWWATHETSQQDIATPEEVQTAHEGIEGREAPWRIEESLDRLDLEINKSEAADNFRTLEDEAKNSPEWDAYKARAIANVYTATGPFDGNTQILGRDKRKLFGLIPTKYDNMHIPPEVEATYLYIKDNYGEGEAAKYADYAETAYVDPAMTDRATAQAAMLDNDVAGRALGTVAARAINVATGLPAAADAIGTQLASWISGENVEPGAAAWSPYTEALDAFSERVDAKNAEDLSRLGTVNDVVSTIAGRDVEVPGIGDFSWGDAYQSVISMVDSMLTNAATGGAGFALGVAGDAYNEAFGKGYSNDQSLLVGLASVLTEALPEKLALDFELSSAKNIYQVLKSKGGFTLATLLYALGNSGLNSVNEALQEGLTTLGNQTVDTFVGGQRSDFAKDVEELWRSGVYMSRDEAEAQARANQREAVAKDAMGGFVGGIIPGVTGATSSAVRDIDTYRRFDDLRKQYNAITASTTRALEKGKAIADQAQTEAETQNVVPPNKRAGAERPPEGTTEATKAKAEERMANMQTVEGEDSVVVNAKGEETSVKLHGITKTGDDAMVTVTDDGTNNERQVKLSDVVISSAKSEVYAYAADMATPQLANTFRAAYSPEQDIAQVANGMEYVYEMAESGGSESYLRKSSMVSALTDDQFTRAYNLGVTSRREKTQRLDEQATARLQTALGNEWRGGKVNMGDIVVEPLVGKQREDVERLRVLAGISGMNFELFQSTANEMGRYTAANGAYDRSTNTVYLDINAGRNYSSDSMTKTALLRTASHEVTHAIQANAPTIYGQIQEAVLDSLSSQGIDIDERIAHVMTRDPSVKSRSAAIDEIVADACETMWRDSEAAQRFKDAHPEAARTLGEKILEFLKNLRDAIKKAFAGEAGAKSVEAKALLNDVDALQRVAELWAEGALQTGEIMGREAFTVTGNGAVVAPDVAEFMDSDNYSAPDNGVFSVRETQEWAESHRKQYPDDENFERNLALIENFDRSVAADSVARYLVPHGRVPKTVRGPLRNNVEYVYTFDMDTKCERTYQFLAYRDAVQKRIGRQLKENEARSLIELMRAYGQMIPCTYCYVEGKRMKLAELYMAYLAKNSENVMGAKYSAEQVFDIVEGARTMVSEYLDDRYNVPENYSLDSTLANESFEGYRDFNMPVSEEAAAQEIYKRYGISDKSAKRVIAGFVAEWLYNRRMDVPTNLVNATADFRSDSIDEKVLAFHDMATKAAQGGAKAKGIENYEPYVGQLQNVSIEDKKYMVGMGGIRKHSSNDFQIQNVQDYMLFFMDLAADKRGGVDWTGHTYTKNLDYARIFAPTNDRINVSIAMYGDNASGIRANTQEGVEWKALQEIRKQYDNVGAMAMVTNNDQLSFALNSDWIDMIIPFHASGMKRSLYYDVLAWTDYTSKQSERLYTKSQMLQRLREKGVKVNSSAKAAEVQRLFMENFEVKTVYNEKTGKRIAPHFFPGETVQHGVVIPGHNNDAQRYFELCEQYGTNPRFFGVKVQDANGNTIDVTEHPSYLKLIKETARTDTPQLPIVAEFDMDYVNKAMKEFKGYANLSEDSYGIVDEFVSEYVGKNRKVGYLTERAQQFKDIREEMADEEAEKSARARGRMLENINRNDAPAVNERTVNYDDVQYSSRDPGDISDREILANAFESLANTDKRREALQEYRDQIDTLEKKTLELEAAQAVIREITDGAKAVRGYASTEKEGYDEVIERTLDDADKGRLTKAENVLATLTGDNLTPEEKSRRDKALQTQREIKAKSGLSDKEFAEWRSLKRVADQKIAQILSDSELKRLLAAQKKAEKLASEIDKIDRQLLKLQATAPLRAIVQREGQKVREQMRTKEREDIAKIRQTQENAAIRKRIARKVKALDELLRKPTDQKHVPDNLKMATLDMLKVFTDDTSVFDKDKLERVRREYALLSDPENSAGVSGMYDEDTANRIQALAETIGGERLSRLKAAQLDEVAKIVDHFTKLVRDANTVYVKDRKERLQDLATRAAMEASGKGIHKENVANKSALWKLLSQGQITPPYFFRRIGGVIGELGEAILEGESRWGRNAAKARDRISEIMTRYNHKEWAGDEDDKLTFTTEAGESITVTREQALSLYATDKRERSNKLQQANHLGVGGIVLQQGRLKLGESREIRADGIPISSADMEKINAWLTTEQKAYADAMVGYISKDMAALGNETSLELHGYSKFGEGYYFPYKTSSDFRKTNLGESEVALIKNMSISKALTRRADNPIIIGDFSQTVAEHVDTMLMYNSFAVPQDMFMRVFDYRLTKSKTVKSSLKTAWGKDAIGYIEQFMRDVYGGVTRDQTDVMGDKWLSKFKANAVLMSASVAIQQPSALMRAMAYVDPQYFVGKPTQKAFDEAMQYSGTAVIKDIGRFDTNTGRSAAEWLIKENYEGIADKARAVVTDSAYRSDVMGMAPEMMDKLTWGIMWDAVKREQAKATGLDIDSEQLKEIAGKRFDEVMRYTQVYDSVMSRSQAMRSKTTYAKMLTAFMAEPTVTYNMFVDAVFDKHTSGAEKRKRIARTMSALMGNIVLNNLLKAIVSAARDDDDEKETYRERYVKSFASGIVTDIIPLNYIPYAKDILSIFRGYDVERSDTAIVNDMLASMKTAFNEDKTMYERTKSLAVFAGMATGLPVKNVWRDIEAAVNTFNTVRGQHVLREGWLMNAAKYGAGSVFGAKDTKANSTARLLDAAISGDQRTIHNEQQHMRAYNNMDDKQIRSSLTSAVKAGYIDGEITEADALRVLTDYADHDDDEAESKINQWRYTAETGNAYSDLKELYLDGEITDAEAINIRTEYGGASREKATKTVNEWAFEKNNGYAYDEMEEAYKDGKITKQQAINARVKGGSDSNDAYWDVSGWEYERDTGDEWEGKYTYLHDAMQSGGDVEAAIRNVYDNSTYKSGASAASAVTSEITSVYKPLYIAASETERTAMEAMLLEAYRLAYELAGEKYYGDERRLKTIRKWLDD